jgi:hypothetical protein
MLAAESSLLPVPSTPPVLVLVPLVSALPEVELAAPLVPGCVPPENEDDASPLRAHADARIAARA